ncbi:hypothetical protein ABVK25_001822 [Lepraria finkii]|uniref:Uncharacterized protein n=1 Tax=Lepraria finkii TaxID=1340010 RepID=A0ABR4BN62_9LECA
MLAAHSLQPNNAAVMDPFLDQYLDGYGPELMSLDQIPISYEALSKPYIAVEKFTPLAAEDLDRDLTQEGLPTTDDQSSVHQHQSTTNDSSTTNEQHLQNEPQINQDAVLDADRNLFKRQINYQLSRGLPFLLGFELEMTKTAANEYVEGFDLGD